MTRPEIRTALPGPKAKAILEQDKAYITPAYTRGYPFVIERGEGPWAFDADGNRFLDFTVGVGVNALGHAPPEVVAAVSAQAGRFLHMAGTDFYYAVMSRYAQKLAEISPWRGGAKVFFTNSGAESTEAAMKLARYATRRAGFVAFFNSFHGRTLGALSLTASKPVQRQRFAPLLPQVAHAPFNDLDFLDRWVFGKILPPDDVAAVFVEALQGEGGFVPAAPAFLQGLRERCTKHGILLVVDETQSGFGRTGRWWAHAHAGIAPDILTTAKPCGGGLPLGAMIARTDLHVWPSGAHANTFGGNPVACAAGLATVEVIERDGLVEHARAMGEHLSSRLQGLVGRHEALLEERGLGLMRAIEFVRSRTTREPDPAARDAAVNRCFEKGLLVLGCGASSLRFLPPLNVTRELLDVAVDILDGVL